MAVNPLFIWAILLLIIKLSKTHQKAEQCTKDDWLRLTENRRLINAQHVKTRLEEFWLGGVGLKTGQTNNIRNNMNYCHDELIIMLVFVTLKTAPSALTERQRKKRLNMKEGERAAILPSAVFFSWPLI